MSKEAKPLFAIGRFVALAMMIAPVSMVSAGPPSVSDPGNHLPLGAMPGAYPAVLTAANVNARPIPGSTINGAGSNNIHLTFPAAGPINWTSSRYNEGDFSLLIGPPSTGDASCYPPDNYFNNYNPLDNGQPFANTTLGWRLNQRTGASLASVRHNGVNNADLLAGNPLGTVHGIAYFAQSNALGWGFRMADGVFANGQEGSVDLVMGVAGFDNNLGESVFNVATAYFPYEQGWTGAWVNSAPAVSPGTPGTFACSSPDLNGLAASTVSWTSNVATVTLPGVNSATDGMLFVAPTHSGDRTNIAAAFPVAGGWKVTVREDDEPDNLLFTGNSILGNPDNGFQFLYVPYDAPNLVGGHVQGATGALVHESGGQSFDLVRTAAGQYEVTVYDSDGVTKLNEDDGMLIMSVAGALGGLNPNLADRAFLSYEYSAAQQAFVIESLELTGALQPMPVSENLFGDVLTPTDADFYFAWIDFDGSRTLGPPGEIPGDFNRDQSVDGEDLAVWSGGFSSGPAGDADGDGDADGNDLLVWQRNVGAGVSASPGVAVPEPSSALLATLLASIAAFSRRHSRCIP